MSFSIVTPCLNRAGTVRRAIESVLAQDYPAFEHIVADGGSTDGTLDILAEYPHLRVISEPDRNLYDAINKGLRQVSGDLIGLLNSDDVYAPGAFAAAAEAMADPRTEILLGGAEIFEMHGGGETISRRFTGMRATGLSEANAIGNVTVINGCFWRRGLMDRVGLFDDRFPLAADKDFFMRLVLAAPDARVLPRVLYRYLSHDGSLTFSTRNIRDKLADHLLFLARTRFMECPSGTPAHAAYRRWHAWAVGYKAFQETARGRIGQAAHAVCEGFKADILWPLRFLARLPAHWRDRGLRRGLPAPDATG